MRFFCYPTVQTQLRCTEYNWFQQVLHHQYINFCEHHYVFYLYSLYTLLGSGIWCAVLCWVGIKMGEDEKLMQGQLHRISLYVAAAMLALGATYYFFVHRQMKKKDHP